MTQYLSIQIKRFMIVPAIGLIILLSGCFGGGGSDSGSATITNVTVGGTTSKGIIKKGLVTAEELDANGDPVATVGTAETGNDGTYQLTLNANYGGGPIQVTVTKGPDTEMKCDVPAGCGTRTDSIADSTNPNTIDFGEWYKPAALTMTALVPVAASNETLSVSVTPYSHMAARRARSTGTVNAASVASANSEVSNLLGGIDILNTPPIDVTDTAAVNGASATQVTFAALASALSNQGLVDADGQPDLDAAIELLANSFASGAISSDDSNDGGDDSAQLSLKEILDAATATFNYTGINDLTGVLAQMQTEIDTAEAGDGTINPEPSTTVADSNLDKVKAFVRDMRTWGNVIEMEAQTPFDAFDAQVTMASDALDILGADNLFAAMTAGIEAAFVFDPANTDLSTYVLPYDNFTSGTITSPSAGVITITDGVCLGYAVNMTFNIPDDQTTATSFTFGIPSASVVGTQNSMTISSGTAVITVDPQYTIDYDAMDLGTAPEPNYTGMTFDLEASFTQKVDSTGTALASPVTFTGVMAFDLVPVDVINSTDIMVLPTTLNLSGTISNNTGNSFVASLVANVTNTGSFRFEGDFAAVGTKYSAISSHPVPMLSWTYTGDDGSGNPVTFNFTSPNITATYTWNSNGSVNVSETYTDWGWVNAYTDPGPYQDIMDYVMNVAIYSNIAYYSGNPYVDGEGGYAADPVTTAAIFLADGGVDGTLVDPEFVIESSSNWIDADIGLSFNAQLTGMPLASINITGDRTGFDAGTGTMTISYGTRKLEVTADVSDINAEFLTVVGSITITNQDGVIVTMSSLTASGGSNFTGELRYNGNKYGDITETDSGYLKVTYNDGTFELF